MTKAENAKKENVRVIDYYICFNIHLKLATFSTLHLPRL